MYIVCIYLDGASLFDENRSAICWQAAEARIRLMADAIVV